MKYIRTKDEVFPLSTKHEHLAQEYGAIKVADNIEELCDEFVVFDSKGKPQVYSPFDVKEWTINTKLFGAIWTDKGLIYVAKLNDKGEWELL